MKWVLPLFVLAAIGGSAVLYDVSNSQEETAVDLDRMDEGEQGDGTAALDERAQGGESTPSSEDEADGSTAPSESDGTASDLSGDGSSTGDSSGGNAGSSDSDDSAGKAGFDSASGGGTSSGEASDGSSSSDRTGSGDTADGGQTGSSSGNTNNNGSDAGSDSSDTGSTGDATQSATVLNTLPTGSYEIQDNTITDTWGVVLKQDKLPAGLRSSTGYVIQVEGKSYELTKNKYNDNIYSGQVSSLAHSKEKVAAGSIRPK